MKKIQFIIIPILLAMVALAGCGSDSNIELVKDGSFENFDGTTIENAFEDSFNDAKWESKTSKKGISTVHFTGAITQQTHDVASYEHLKDYKDIDASYDPNTSHRNLMFFAEKTIKKFGKDEVYDKKIRPYRLNVIGSSLNPSDKKEAIRQYNAIVLDHYFEVIKNKYWPVGSQVEFVWSISNDKKRFELSSFSNDSWFETKESLQSILKTIYTDSTKLPIPVELPKFKIRQNNTDVDRDQIARWVESMVFDFQEINLGSATIPVYYNGKANGFLGKMSLDGVTYIFASSVNESRSTTCGLFSEASIVNERIIASSCPEAEILFDESVDTFAFNDDCEQCGMGATLSGDYVKVASVKFNMRKNDTVDFKYILIW